MKRTKRRRKLVQEQDLKQLERVQGKALKALRAMEPSLVAVQFAEGQRAGVLLGFLDNAATAVLEDVAPHVVPDTLGAINQRAVYLVNYLVGCTGLPAAQQDDLVSRLLGTPAPEKAPSAPLGGAVGVLVAGLVAVLLSLPTAGCSGSGAALHVEGQDGGAWAADGALEGDGEARAGAGGADASGDRDATLEGFGRDAGGDPLGPDAGPVDGGSPVELGDAAAAADAGCVENDCGGCGELRCAAAWNGACVRGEPCGPCPAGCFPINIVGLAPKFQCDGDESLVCNVCACD